MTLAYLLANFHEVHYPPLLTVTYFKAGEATEQKYFCFGFVE